MRAWNDIDFVCCNPHIYNTIGDFVSVGACERVASIYELLSAAYDVTHHVDGATNMDYELQTAY
jgi:hypothetical protein